jgi:hypothetical protein
MRVAAVALVLLAALLLDACAGCGEGPSDYRVALTVHPLSLMAPEAVNPESPGSFVDILFNEVVTTIGKVEYRSCKEFRYVDIGKFIKTDQEQAWVAVSVFTSEDIGLTGTLTAQGDVATQTVHLVNSTPNEGHSSRLSSLSATGTFSAKQAQAAINQIFKGKGRKYQLDASELIGVPVHWHAEAVVDSQTVSKDFDIEAKLYEWAVRQ